MESRHCAKINKLQAMEEQVIPYQCCTQILTLTRSLFDNPPNHHHLQAEEQHADMNFEHAHAGSSLTFPMQCSALRKNGHVVIKGRPCKVRFYCFLCREFAMERSAA